jgi:hypothetical protein
MLLWKAAQGDLMKTEEEATALERGLSWRGRVSIAAFVAALILGVVTPAALLIWEGASATAIVLRGDAGAFIASTSSPGGFFSPTMTSVQTTMGSIAVTGAFSAPRGQALTIERTNKQSLQLCAAGVPASCANIVGTWPGQVPVTLEADGVFDFQRSGLTYDNLGFWLMVGLFLSFIATIAVAYATVRNSKDDRPSGCDAEGRN